MFILPERTQSDLVTSGRASGLTHTEKAAGS